MGLNQHLLNIICLQQEDKKVKVAEMIGSLVSFLMICLVVAKNSWASQTPYLEVQELEEVFQKLEEMPVKGADLRFRPGCWRGQ